MHLRILVIATVVLGSTLAWADTIEEKRVKDQAEKMAADRIKRVNENCKTSVPETGYIDWSSWDGKTDKAGNACKWVLFATATLCRSDKIAQETVAKNVKTMVCKGDSTDDIKFELKGTKLVVHTLDGAKDSEKKTKAWLTKNLE
jgi:hypothetical protein